MEEPKRVYFICETVLAEDGGFIPCIAEEGLPGFYKTDWNWGTDREMAEQIANQKNEAMGFTPKQAIKVVLSSMNAGARA